MNFEDENDKITEKMQESMRLTNKISKIEKSMKKQIKIIESKKQLNGTPEGNTIRYRTDFEERKVGWILKSLKDVAELHPASTHFFNMVKEGVEDCLQRLLSREKFKNICLLDSFTKAEKELKKERIEREVLECQYTEMQERAKQMHKLDQEYRRLKLQEAEVDKEEDKYHEQLDWLRNREEEVIKRLDSEEIDLLTERLDIYGVDTQKPWLNELKKSKYLSIPPLDMNKLQEMKDMEEEEYEEEEEEEEDYKEELKNYTQDSSFICSENERMDELKKRKDQVIALLNQTFQDE